MRLLGVEMTRFRSRRAIVLMLVGASLLTVFIAGTTVWNTRPISEADRTAAEQMAAREAQQPWVQEELALCIERPRRYGGPEMTPEDCEAMIVPSAENYLWRATLDLGEEQRGSGVALAMFLAAIMVVAGTTFAGADWASGSMSNQLLFEPRRTRVWLAKAGALFAAATVAAAVLLTVFWVALYLVAESRGIATGATVQESIRWMSARAALLTGVGALGGYALTMLLRHTVGALGLLFAYVAAGEAIVASLPVEGIGRWSLANNLMGWLHYGYEYWDSSLPCSGGGFDCQQTAILSSGEAIGYLGPLLLLVLVLSAYSFRRRDIP